MSTATPTSTAVPLDNPADAVTRYQSAAAHYRELAAAGDYDGCEYVADEMRRQLREMAAADSDLIRAA